MKKADADLGAAFEAAAKFGSPDDIQVILMPKKNDTGILNQIKSATQNLLKGSHIQAEASQFLIRGKMKDSDRVEPLDLLRDQLIMHKKIIRINKRCRALNMEDAYKAVSQAYLDLKPELQEAASISI